MLQTQTVKAETLALTKKLMTDSYLKDFVLVGGTALSLQLGHRASIDIDLFNVNFFDTKQMAEHLESEYHADQTRADAIGTFCFIEEVKVDIVTHPYRVQEPPQTVDGIRMMSLSDIAAMKLYAIFNSGTRLKDFVDICALTEMMPLSKMYDVFEAKYAPHANRSVARLALLDHSRIDFKEKVYMLKDNFDKTAMIRRIQRAVEYPDKIFPAPKPRKIKEQTQELRPQQKKGRGLR